MRKLVELQNNEERSINVIAILKTKMKVTDKLKNALEDKEKEWIDVKFYAKKKYWH